MAEGSSPLPIVALALAQLAMLWRAAHWTGGKDEEIKGKASKEEIEKLRTEIATAKATMAETAAAAAKGAIAGVLAAMVAEEIRKVGAELRAERAKLLDELKAAKDREHDRINARIDRLDTNRESLARLHERAERLAEILGRVDELDASIEVVKDAINAWSRAGAKLEWRVESLEEMAKRKLGSHPRMFAVRDAPPAITSPTFDPETTSPGLGQQSAFLPAPPAVRAPSASRPGSGALGKRPPIPRKDDEEEG